MFNLKFKYPIGIDIGSQDIYAVQLKEIRHGFAIRGMLHRGIDEEVTGIPDANDTLVPLLKEISRNRQFLGKRVVVHFPSQNIFSFPIRFQVGNTETIEEVIIRESKERLPFPMEEAIIDYPSIVSLPSGEASEYKATIVTVHRDHMKQYLLMLKQAGLIVEAVDFGVSSLIRLHNHLYDAIRNPIILCNIGQTQSLLSIVTKDSILAQHNVAWGIQILLRRILTNLELSNEKDKAKILLIKYGLVHEDRESCNNGPDVTEDITTDNIRRAIYQIIASYMEELTHELHKIVGYVRSEERNVVFEGIYMYGQAPFIRCLDHYLERRLNSPTTLINPMTKVVLSDNSTLPDISEGAPFALALGLAMRKVPWL
jgi:type IV pilus assembly protein PilM